MNADLNVLTGGQAAAKAAPGRRNKTGDSKQADRPKADFGRELAHSRVARNAGANHTSPGAAKSAPQAGARPADHAKRTPNPAEPARTTHDDAHRLPAGDHDSAATQTADGSKMTRKWLLRVAREPAASKTPAATNKTAADQPASSTAPAGTEPPAQPTLARAPTTDKSVPVARAKTTRHDQPRTTDKKAPSDGDKTDDPTRNAALALIAPIPAIPRPVAGPPSAGDGKTDGIDLAGRGGRPAAPTALAQLLARADGDTTAGDGSQTAGKDDSGSRWLDTLTSQPTDTLARLADRAAKSGLARAQASADAGTTTNTPLPGVLSPHAGAQSGPNAAIAGGTAGQAAGASGAPLTASLGVPLGSDGWNAALGQHTLRLAAGGSRQAQIQLHPRELGQINISLSINDHNQAQLHLASPHAHVRDAVEAALPQLKQSLAAGGLTLGQASVGDQGSQAAFGETGKQGQSGRGGQSPDPGPTIETIGEAEPAPAARPVSGLRSGIDIFA